MFSVSHKGNFNATIKFLRNTSTSEFRNKLRIWGEQGVKALSDATPKDSGKTADSWDYRITRSLSSVSIVWVNEHNVGSAPLAVLLQYGHGTRQGGYVEGRDFINPAMRPVFDNIAKEAWAILIKN